MRDTGRGWFIAGLILDVALLAFGSYMAKSAAEIAIRTGGDTAPVAIAILFAALPGLCLAAPFAARRARRRNRPPAQLVALFAAPWVYALFLVVFLFNS
jgi:membrane protein implicated in regulation of membrane protease activity